LVKRCSAEFRSDFHPAEAEKVQRMQHLARHWDHYSPSPMCNCLLVANGLQRLNFRDQGRAHRIDRRLCRHHQQHQRHSLALHGCRNSTDLLQTLHANGGNSQSTAKRNGWRNLLPFAFIKDEHFRPGAYMYGKKKWNGDFVYERISCISGQLD
jgi:hypothetical protein